MKVRFLLTVVFLCLAAPPLRAAAIYAWPLEKNYGISATFGESRNDHVHAGIDLSTNGETGLPVHAIEAGKVYRLKVQKRGYGRALYIQHDNGMISVYGHLESYSTDLGLEQLYRQKVAETGNKYVGDIFVDPPVPVDRGTVVAYSGETGAGYPHLHLELRRGEEFPVNPLTNGLEDTLDPVPPSFQAAYLYPASGDAPIDGELETQVVRFQKGDSGYVADHVPVVRGEFNVSVSVYDAALRPYHRNPYRISYSIDNQQVYEVVFSEFSYTQPEHFGLIYDLGKPGAAFYESPIFLSNPYGVTVPFGHPGSRIATGSLQPGRHRLQILASDTNGNTSPAVLDFIVNQPPSIRLDSLKSDGKDLIAGISMEDPDWKKAPPSGFAGEIEYSTDQGKSFAPFPLVSMDLQTPVGSHRLICRTPLSMLGTGRVLIKMRGYDGVEYSPFSVLAVENPAAPVAQAPSTVAPGAFTVRKYADTVKLEFNTNDLLTFPLQVGLDNRQYAMNSWNLTSYSALLPVSPITTKMTLALSNGQQLVLPVHYVTAQQGGTVVGDNYTLSVDPDVLYRDAFIWPDQMPAYRTHNLYPVGPILQLGPRGLAFKKNAVLSFSYPAGTLHPEKLSVYRWNRARQRWDSQPAVVDTSARTVTAKVSYLDLFALIYDNVPPVVKYIFPKRNSVTRNTTPKLAATVSDEGMLINDDRVTFYVDGVAHAADYDPDRDLATLQLEHPLRKGYHRFRVEAYDWGGNKTVTSSVTFRVR